MLSLEANNKPDFERRCNSVGLWEVGHEIPWRRDMKIKGSDMETRALFQEKEEEISVNEAERVMEETTRDEIILLSRDQKNRGGALK